MAYGSINYGSGAAGAGQLPVAIMRWLAMQSGGGQAQPPAAAVASGGSEKGMRDYLGGDVAAAQEMIKALSPQPPQPQAPVPASKPQGAFAGGGKVKGKRGYAVGGAIGVGSVFGGQVQQQPAPQMQTQAQPSLPGAFGGQMPPAYQTAAAKRQPIGAVSPQMQTQAQPSLPGAFGGQMPSAYQTAAAKRQPIGAVSPQMQTQAQPIGAVSPQMQTQAQPSLPGAFGGQMPSAYQTAAAKRQPIGAVSPQMQTQAQPIGAVSPQMQTQAQPSLPGAFGGGGPALLGRAACGGAFSSGGQVVGPGDGRSDSIPVPMQDGGQAALSNDEYVIPADAVAALGDGSSDAGAKVLDAFVNRTRAGWVDKLETLPGPKAGGRKKFLGGLFKGEKAGAELELTGGANVASNSIAGLIKGIGKNRQLNSDDVAAFNSDQQSYFDQARNFANNDPTGYGAKTDQSARQLQETIGGVDGVSGRVDGQYGNLDRGQAEAGQLIANGDDVRRTIQGQYGNLAQGQGEISGLLGAGNDIRRTIQSQYGQVADAQRRVKGQYKNLDDAQGRVKSQYKNLNDAQGRVRNEYGNLADAQGRVRDQYGNLDSQQGRIGGAQDYLSGVIANGGEEDALIDATLANFDNQAAINTEDRARQRLMRGAFGARRDVAESTEMADRERQRALTESQLRTQGVDRKIAATAGIGSLAGQSGNLTGQAANLAGTQGNLTGQAANLAGTQGALTGQAANLASTQGALTGQAANLASTQGSLSGVAGNLAQGENAVLGTQSGLVGQRASLTNAAGNLAGQETGVLNAQGNLVSTRGTLTNAAGNLAGTQGNLLSTRGGLATAGAGIAGDQRNAGAGNLDLLRGVGDRQQVQQQQILDAPYNRLNKFNQVLSGAPSTSYQTGGGPSAFQQGVGAVAAIGGAASGFGFGNKAAQNGGHVKRLKKANGGAFNPSADLVPDRGDGGIFSRSLNRFREEKAAKQAAPTGAKGGAFGAGAGAGGPDMATKGGGDPLGVVEFADGGVVDYRDYFDMMKGDGDPLGAVLFDRARESQTFPGIMSPGEALAAMPAERPSWGAFNEKLDAFEDRNGRLLAGPAEAMKDAVGLNYLGPDEDGSGGRPDAIQRRAMKDATAPAAAEPAAKPSLPERVKAIVASGQPSSAPRPQQRASAGAGAPPPVPASKPRGSGAFMPEVLTRKPEAAAAPSIGAFRPESTMRAPEPAAEAAATDGRSFGDKLRDGFENPLTQFGLALLASDKNNFAQAAGEAGMATARYVGDQRRQKRADEREARQDADADERLKLAYIQVGLSEKQAEAAVANQKIDNERADRALGITEKTAAENLALRQKGLAQTQAYQQAQLGQGQARLGLARAAEERLKKQGGGAKGDPSITQQINELDQARVEAMLLDDTEEVERIDALKAGLVPLPEGAVLGDVGLKSGGKVKKKPAKRGAFAMAA